MSINPIAVGATAPDITLPNTEGQPVSLSSLRGQPVAVVFFPFAFSGICTGELCTLRDNIKDFQASGVKLVAISCDAMYAQGAFAKAENYDFTLLSDFWPHGAAAKAFGVFNDEMGMAVRGTFLLDAEGKVRWEVVNDPGTART
ncbi:MAG: peroxiredoxin, partial [Bifidobacteriaceae bacterium]|nr:peroxiredoxin [Bifidobacteriaceae bacterium]